jgi:hypothetical protein
MKTNKEKEITVALLTEKLEKLSGKKVTFVDNDKVVKIKKLTEALEKVTGKKVTFVESDEYKEEYTEGELEEGLFGGKTKEEFEKEAMQTINIWATKGYKRPDSARWAEIIKQAEADKFKGKLGVDKEKNVTYRPVSTIPVQSAGGLMGSVGRS